MTVPPVSLVAYAVLPSGVIAIPRECAPTVIGVPAVFVAMSIGETDALSRFVTRAVLPSGVIAIASGLAPTVIAGAAALVVRLIGVTVVPPVLATRRSCRRA